MRVLDRLVLKRFFGAYLGFLAMVLVVYVFADLFGHVEHFSGSKVGFLRAVAGYYLVTLPEIYYLFAPFLALIAAMWVMASLQRANELIPLLSAGIRPRRIVAPVFLAVTLFAALMWADRELVVPALADLRREVSRNRKDSRLPAPVADAKGGVLSGRVYLTAERRLVEARYTLLDERGREVYSLLAWTADPVLDGWLLRDGVIVRQGDPTRVERIAPAGFPLRTDIRPIDIEAAIDEVHYLSSRQLKDQIDRLPGRRSLEVQLAKRLAYPASSLVLLVLGLPFVLRPEKQAAVLGLLGCLGLCALFFVVTSVGEDMGGRPGGPPPLVAAWAANAVFGAAGVAAFLRLKV